MDFKFFCFGTLLSKGFRKSFFLHILSAFMELNSFLCFSPSFYRIIHQMIFPCFFYVPFIFPQDSQTTFLRRNFC